METWLVFKSDGLMSSYWMFMNNLIQKKKQFLGEKSFEKVVGFLWDVFFFLKCF